MYACRILFLLIALSGGPAQAAYTDVPTNMIEFDATLQNSGGPFDPTPPPEAPPIPARIKFKMEQLILGLNRADYMWLGDQIQLTSMIGGIRVPTHKMMTFYGTIRAVGFIDGIAIFDNYAAYFLHRLMFDTPVAARDSSGTRYSLTLSQVVRAHALDLAELSGTLSLGAEGGLQIERDMSGDLKWRLRLMVGPDLVINQNQKTFPFPTGYLGFEILDR